MNTFVQLNLDSHMAETYPVGYFIPDNPYACWEWKASTARGYGHMRHPETKKVVRAHRFVYEQQTGEIIPKGYECHHVCANKRCVNPSHIEIVTHKDHFAIDDALLELAKANAARQRNIEECPQGHPYSGSNLYVDPHGHRHCRICRRAAWYRHYGRTMPAVPQWGYHNNHRGSRKVAAT